MSPFSFKMISNQKNKLLSIFISLISLLNVDHLNGQQKNNHYLVDYVNPLMGTDSKKDFSNGNTYPAIATPFGMNFWTPMTAEMGNGWTYNYNDNKIRGIKQTHQPSPWLNDYAAFSLMAVTRSVYVCCR